MATTSLIRDSLNLLQTVGFFFWPRGNRREFLGWEGIFRPCTVNSAFCSSGKSSWINWKWKKMKDMPWVRFQSPEFHPITLSRYYSLSKVVAERGKRLEAIGWNSGYGSRHLLELSKLQKNLSDDDLYILWHCSSFFNLSLAKEKLENTSHQPNCLT